MFRKRTYDSIVHTTFDTPLVRLTRIVPPEHRSVFLKLEFFNPYSSVKDRIGRAMIETAEKAGILTSQRRLSSRPVATRVSPWRL